MEGGSDAGKAKVDVAEVNEVDRIEVVRDLGFSKVMINIVFCYVYFLSVLINIDHGAIPAALNDIKEEL